MAALVCDLCGGKLMMGAGGIAVCDSCGMEHSTARMKEKIQEIKGTVRVDNSHMIDNYLEMAQTALDAGNNAEAETYCNKIIEIKPTHYKALMIKGEAVAWQSTLQNSRVDEGVAAFAKAINNAPEEEKEELAESAMEQIKRLSVAMIALREERFAKWPDKEETAGFMSDIASIFGTVVNFLTQTGKIIPLGEIMAPIATKINRAVVAAWKNIIWPDYYGDPNDSDDRANKYEWQRFIERIGYCTNLIEKAISLDSEDDEGDIQRYENLIFLHKAAIDSCSWDYKYTDWGKNWYKEWSLTDEAKRSRRQMIATYVSKIREIKVEKVRREVAEKAEKDRIVREMEQKQFNEYWNEHADEKKNLEYELENLKSQINTLDTDLNSQVSELNKKIAAISRSAEIANIDERVKQLETEKARLGWFKGKEKKNVQDQIEMLSREKSVIQTRMDAEKKNLKTKINAAQADTQKKLANVQNRVNEINSILTSFCVCGDSNRITFNPVDSEVPQGWVIPNISKETTLDEMSFLAPSNWRSVKGTDGWFYYPYKKNSDGQLYISYSKTDYQGLLTDKAGIQNIDNTRTILLALVNGFVEGVGGKEPYNNSFATISGCPALITYCRFHAGDTSVENKVCCILTNAGGYFIVAGEPDTLSSSLEACMDELLATIALPVCLLR